MAARYAWAARPPPAAQALALAPTGARGRSSCTALHTHTTLVGPLHKFQPGAADRDPHDHPRPFLTLQGCTTLVLMGPLVRAWGFVRDGRWYPWRVYDEKFGHGSFRCPE